MPVKSSTAKLKLLSKQGPDAGLDLWPTIFGGMFGCGLGLALLKFGNPVILDRLVEPPQNVWEYLFQSWPLKWGCFLLVPLAVAGFKAGSLKTQAPRWLILLPLLWLGWQFAAAARTVSPALTRVTLVHFASCVMCFYLGLFCLGRAKQLVPFAAALLGAFLFVLWLGFAQHYGGLEETRRQLYELPNWQEFPPEYLKKVASNRIFSSLVYPNTLAASLLLYAPFLVTFTWIISARFPPVIRGVLAGLVGYSSLACLYWSGSKAGWLVALLVSLLILMHQPLPARTKLIIINIVLVMGLAAFFLKFAPYFQKGATSAAARMQYWEAAWQTFREHPVFGTGPGTFSIPYAKIKLPEAEMARLTHNDYLEQACDSGLIGFLTYSGFIFSSLVILYRKSNITSDTLFFSVWLGLFGWAVHSSVEFNLYVPALAWPAFAFLGWLLNRIAIKSDKNESIRQVKVG